jgi:FAD/FMN-containing dehydrogenase
LMPAPRVALPVCGVYEGAAAGAAAIERVLGSGVIPAVIEYFDAGTLRAAGGGFPGGLPNEAGFLVIVEADGSEDEARELAEALGADALRPRPEELWRWRDGVSHAVRAQRGGKISEDVAVPVDRLAEAIDETLAIGARHGLEACSWGHAGDGNLHSTFLLTPGDDDELSRARAAAEELFEMAIRLGGTISGEHGVGILKNGFLSHQWSPGAVAAHRAIKAALDPQGIFNPGKKLP